MAGGISRFGWYRYGYSEYRSRDRARSDRGMDEGPSEEELFGTGVALRSTTDPEGVPWDFVADSSGDLAATRGADELRKDLAFNTARESVSLIGTLTRARDRTRLEDRIEQVAVHDSRVNGAAAAVKPNRDVANQTDVQVDIEAETEELPRMVFSLR